MFMKGLAILFTSFTVKNILFAFTNNSLCVTSDKFVKIPKYGFLRGLWINKKLLFCVTWESKGEESVSLDTASDNLLNLSRASSHCFKSIAGRERRRMVHLCGLLMSVPLTNDEIAKFQMEKERNYHLLWKAAFAWIWKCRCEELVFAIMHSQ